MVLFNYAGLANVKRHISLQWTIKSKSPTSSTVLVFNNLGVNFEFQIHLNGHRTYLIGGRRKHARVLCFLIVIVIHFTYIRVSQSISFRRKKNQPKKKNSYNFVVRMHSVCWIICGFQYFFLLFFLKSSSTRCWPLFSLTDIF